MTDAPDRARLERAARAVLAALDPDDLDRLLGGDVGPARLIADMVACAEKICAKLAEPVSPEQDELLLAATLTRQSGSTVQQNAGHAFNRFQLFQRTPGLPTAVVLPTAVALLIGEADSPELVAALATAHRVALALDLSPERGEPPWIQTMAAAAVACLDVEDPAADPVRAASEILDRGAELAAAYRAAGAELPGSSLTVRGNADFLVQIAGYAQAVRERRGAAPAVDAVADLGRSLPRLEAALHRSMTVAPPYPKKGAEPDSVGYFSEAASALDGTGRRPAGKDATVREVFQRLSRGLQLSRITYEGRTLPAGGWEELPVPTVVPHSLDDVADSQRLADRVVGLLTAGASQPERQVVAKWVCGLRDPEYPDDLHLLLPRLRGLMAGLGRPEDQDPPVDPSIELAAPKPCEMAAVLRVRLAAQLAREPQRRDDRALAAEILPALWTSRDRVINAVSQRIKQDERERWSASRLYSPLATILAARAVRGPLQVVLDTSQEGHVPDGTCVTTATGLGLPRRCTERVAGTPAPTFGEVCPTRPWGEEGAVENHATIGALVERHPDTVRRQLERYRREGGGRWLELAHANRF